MSTKTNCSHGRVWTICTGKAVRTHKTSEIFRVNITRVSNDGLEWHEISYTTAKRLIEIGFVPQGKRMVYDNSTTYQIAYGGAI